MKTKFKTKKVIITISTLVLLVVFILAGISLIFPNGAIGYQRLMRDNHTNNYTEGDFFGYDKFDIKVSIIREDIKPNLFDCSKANDNFLFNRIPGIYYKLESPLNPDAEKNCTTANQKLTDEANSTATTYLSYEIKNNSNDIGTIPNDWLKAYDQSGATVIKSQDSATIGSKQTVIFSTPHKPMAKSTKITSIVATLPTYAPQNITPVK